MFFSISNNNLKDAHSFVPTVSLSTLILYLGMQCNSVLHFTSVHFTCIALHLTATAKKSLSPKSCGPQCKPPIPGLYCNALTEASACQSPICWSRSQYFLASKGIHERYKPQKKKKKENRSTAICFTDCSNRYTFLP